MSIEKLLLRENLSSYVDNGELQLFHYSKTDQPTLTLSPNRFGENPYSRREKQTSDYPRVFFYVDPQQKERFFKSKTFNLYTATVKANSIYNLKTDPNDYIQEVKDKNNGALNFDMLFQTIDNNNYKGVYYETSKRSIVAYFDPIVVTQTET